MSTDIQLAAVLALQAVAEGKGETYKLPSQTKKRTSKKRKKRAGGWAPHTPSKSIRLLG